jgi:type II secretory pathway component GspD/PulD (secretin)
MSRVTTSRAVLGLLMTLGLGLCALAAQDSTRPAPAKGEAGQAAKRTFYVVKHGSAKDLASVLAKHFKGDVEVQLVPDAASNCLLLRASPRDFDEVTKLLEQLDRRPQLVAVQVWVGEVLPQKGADGKPLPADKLLDERQLTGPVDAVLAKTKALRNKGLLGDLNHVQTTVVENQPSSVLVGSSIPYVTGVTNAGGKVLRRISYRNTGVSVQVTARVTPEKSIHLEIDVSNSRPHVRPDGIPIGFDENGTPIRATEFLTANLKNKLTVSPEQVAFAQGIETNAKADQPQPFVLVSARVVEPGAAVPAKTGPGKLPGRHP